MTDTERKVRRFIARDLMNGQNEASIAPDQSLFLDSVALIQLVDFLETEFNIQLGREDMARENFVTVRAIANLVAHKTA
jgi:acyl carrier protein